MLSSFQVQDCLVFFTWKKEKNKLIVGEHRIMNTPLQSGRIKTK